MFELEKNEEVMNLVALTKSDSGVSGPSLARAHIKLGSLLAEHMNFPPEDTTVVAMMRGGIFFAEGLYFALGCKLELYDPKKGGFVRPITKHVILADSVINSGKTVIDILKPDMYVACCVINEKAVELFSDRLYAVRVSSNSFVGSNVKIQSGNRGPDTTMRLFNQI